jgi:hypothetical protein
MFSFGFQKAFQRGFEVDDDEVFFTGVRTSLHRTMSTEIKRQSGIFQRPWKVPRPSSRCLSTRWFQQVTYVLRQIVRNSVISSSRQL